MSGCFCFEIFADFVDSKKQPVPHTIHVCAVDLSTAIQRAATYFTTAGCTSVAVTSARQLWSLEVLPS